MLVFLNVGWISLTNEGQLDMLYLDVCSFNTFCHMQILKIDPLEAGCITLLKKKEERGLT